MNYVSLNDFKWGWIFRHRELPVDSESLGLIRPLDKASANQFWKTHISKEAAHASHFLGDDWPSRNGVWQPKENWQLAWEADANAMPALMAQHIPWETNVTVFFCYDVDHIVQTRWDIFQRHWKNFLFVDDQPMLLGKSRDEVVRFFNDGSYQTGIRPKR
ncbi:MULTISPECIES: DUF2947 family protein [Oceanospirillaceae]|jgi:hypothetical protein|uniref:DUF2947 family protein n=1 Tax=Oceanobacter antarcticus TaxID=3133425 RepID=A0ABW8NFN7_9GAMM|tara:strand:- start:459 stop:938 length:480 start_codon:yes stop_codon:yes gene_type:complete